MAKVSSPQEVFDAIPGHVQADVIKGVNAKVQFDISGEGGGQWVVAIADGQAQVEKGTTPEPSVTVGLSASDYVAMVNGELNPMNAFMQGKLKVSGDMALVMKLQSLFGRR